MESLKRMGLTGLTTVPKRLVRRTVGLWPARELYNKVMLGPALPGLVAFEDREVRRHAAALGRTPTAKVAVIVPTYKRPQRLLMAVDSILKQEVQDFVVMVVDDGAGLPELPRDQRVTGVSLERNIGIAGLVRNVGIRLTDSRYLAFLDDDNMWTPQHLSLTLAALEAGAHFVYTDLRRRTADGVEVDVLSRDFDRRLLADGSSWMDTNAIVLPRTRRARFSRLPRVPKTMPREDWEFAWRQTRGARVQHIAVPTVEYLVNPESYFTAWRLPEEER
jgi:hypothetical protein